MMRGLWTLTSRRNRHFCAGKSASLRDAGRFQKKPFTGSSGSDVATLVAIFASIAGAAVYRYGEHSWRFRIESSDNIEISGTHNVTHAQVMEVLGGDIGRNIFFIPLSERKAQLEKIPWVESASVMRFVPNRLSVEIHERTPVAFARVGSRIMLIDGGGTLMELPGPGKQKYSFPVIVGMNPGEPLSTREARMKIYNDLVRQLDADGSRYSQALSEVDISDPDDVKVETNDSGGAVLVHLGSSDYLSRYRIYVTHIQALAAAVRKARVGRPALRQADHRESRHGGHAQSRASHARSRKGGDGGRSEVGGAHPRSEWQANELHSTCEAACVEEHPSEDDRPSRPPKRLRTRIRNRPTRPATAANHTKRREDVSSASRCQARECNHQNIHSTCEAQTRLRNSNLIAGQRCDHSRQEEAERRDRQSSGFNPGAQYFNDSGPKIRCPTGSSISMPNPQAKLLTAIDVGSAKTCALVAEITESGLRYRGHGVADSRGSRKGVIVDLEKAVASIQKAVEAAEDIAGAPIEHALIGMAGSHMRGMNSHGGITFGTRPREIAPRRSAQAVDKARAIPLPNDREILHLLPQEFILDDQPGVHDPLGMMAARLEVRVHMITSASSATQNWSPP